MTRIYVQISLEGTWNISVEEGRDKFSRCHSNVYSILEELSHFFNLEEGYLIYFFAGRYFDGRK